jgi:glycosyltransferase involved in cell wall biosynthesis
LALAGRNFDSARARLSEFVTGAYDLLWVDAADTLAVLGPALPKAPLVVDLDDREDLKAAARTRTLLADGARRPRRWPRLAVQAALGRREAAGWRRLQFRAVDAAQQVVVASQLDADRLAGLARSVRVVPNGGSEPSPGWNPRTKDPGSADFTAVFFGLLTYPPNVDAARMLANQVAPLLRSRSPGASVRLVGRAGDAVQALHDPPKVIVTGWVDDLSAELIHADVALVPIRYGAGTRIKILDAWAHEIPVVTTTMGAEGLDVHDGVDVLVADTPQAMADSCMRLLAQRGLREALVAEGRRRFYESHRWSEVEIQAAAVATDTLSTVSPDRSGPPRGEAGDPAPAP